MKVTKIISKKKTVTHKDTKKQFFSASFFSFDLPFIKKHITGKKKALNTISGRQESIKYTYAKKL